MACGGGERYTNCNGAPCYPVVFGEGRNVTCTCPLLTFEPGDAHAGPVATLRGDCPATLAGLHTIRAGCAYNVPPGGDWARYALRGGAAGLRAIVAAVRAARPSAHLFPFSPDLVCADALEGGGDGDDGDDGDGADDDDDGGSLSYSYDSKLGRRRQNGGGSNEGDDDDGGRRKIRWFWNNARRRRKVQ